jgi:hypothetical protein
MRLALQPEILATANAYLRMRSMLRSVELWLNVPTPGPARDTQLWHRDADDRQNLKVFIYLTDVSVDSGPFCYIPGTQPGGRRLAAPIERAARVDDPTMARAVPERGWRVGVAPRTSVTLADTTGWHKGLKPTKGHRVLLMAQYTSGRPAYPRDMAFRGAPANLTIDQRYALAPRTEAP